MKKINCDVVVVGAGPGGSMAAKTCAKYGLDTVLVERKEKPSKPNSITCAVSIRLFDYIKIDKKFVDTPIYKIRQFSSDGTEIHYGEPNGFEVGYALNRKTFDNEILKLALKEGAEYLNKTRATGLIREDGEIKGVKAKIDEKEDVEIRSNIVIGADGAESKVGRWAKIYKKSDLGIEDMYSSLDWLLDGADIEPCCIYQYCGWKNIPDIFYQLFPHGSGKTSLCVQTNYASFYSTKKGEFYSATDYFIKTHPSLSNAKIVRKGGGGFSYHPLEKFTTDGVMLVGDAAHQMDSLWGAGILYAMDAGTLAGETAVEAHDEGDFSSNLLSRYEKRWYKLHGEQIFFNSYMVKVWMSIGDNKLFDTILHSLKDNNSLITNELFEKITKSPKLISNLFYTLRRKYGLNIKDILSFLPHIQKYYRNYWDLFVQ